MAHRQNITVQDLKLNINQDVDSELTILETMADELEEYILDSTVYRTIFVATSSGRYRLMMSGGDLLARLQTLQAMRERLTQEQKDRLNTIMTQVETIKGSLQMPLQTLLRRELKSRLAALEWSRAEEAEEGEEEDLTPAETANYLHIAVLRQEMDEEVPHGMNEELTKLEQRLQKALDGLTIGQEYKL